MIYDRTLSDVNAALFIRKNKVQKGIELTESDIETLERGFITINTLNRIENKQFELKSSINQMGYWNDNVINREWEYSDIFDETELKRLFENVDSLKKAFFVSSEMPQTASPKYHYDNINNIEKILHDFVAVINDITSRYKKCGTFNCGVK